MIYFVRHGESEANQRGVFAGQRENSPLTEKGRGQAKDTAEEIKGEGFALDRIVSSPLRRTQETAEIIAKEIGLDLSKVSVDNRLAEYDMGSLSGTPIKSISSSALISASGAEDVDNFRERVFSCIKEYSKEPGNVLIVSHAGVGRMLETIRENKETKLFYDLPAYPNCSVIKLDWFSNP